MINKGFRCVSKEIWNEMKENHDKYIEPRTRLIALRSSNPHIPKLPDWAHDPYIFAFPGENTNAWNKYVHGNDYLRGLLKSFSTKYIAFEFELNKNDEVYVVERAHMADYYYCYNSSFSDAIKKYALSRVPLIKYQEDYKLPELIIKNPIEIERFIPRFTIEKQYA